MRKSTVVRQSKRSFAIMENEPSMGKLTEKQRNVWNYIQKHVTVTQRQVREDLKLEGQTTFHILNKFIKLNRLKKLGENRGIQYVIHPLK